MNLPKVSIITVVYNAKEALKLTLESIFAIEYDDLEVIVVDGGSTDGTKYILEENYLKITQWISEPDGGIYDAMNKAMQMSTGEYIWFVNAGDKVFDPAVLKNTFKGREQYADIFYGETIVASQQGDILGYRGKKVPRKLSFKSFKRGMSVCHQSMIVRRAIAPLYDLKYRFSSDVDWVIKMLKAGATTQNTHLIYSIFEDGGATTQNRIKSLKERFRIMVHYYGTVSTMFHHFMFLFNIFLPKYRSKSQWIK